MVPTKPSSALLARAPPTAASGTPCKRNLQASYGKVLSHGKASLSLNGESEFRSLAYAVQHSPPNHDVAK